MHFTEISICKLRDCGSCSPCSRWRHKRQDRQRHCLSDRFDLAVSARNEYNLPACESRRKWKLGTEGISAHAGWKPVQTRSRPMENGGPVLVLHGSCPPTARHLPQYWVARG